MITKAERKDEEKALSLFKALWQDADERELKGSFLHSLTGENLITYLASVQGQTAGFDEVGAIVCFAKKI